MVVKRTGFTLLELLVVLAVIAIMAGSVGWCCVLGKNAAVKAANVMRCRLLAAVSEVANGD